MSGIKTIVDTAAAKRSLAVILGSRKRKISSIQMREAKKTAERIRASAPQRTGELASSIVVEQKGDGQVIISAKAKHARYQEGKKRFFFNNVKKMFDDIPKKMSKI